MNTKIFNGRICSVSSARDAWMSAMTRTAPVQEKNVGKEDCGARMRRWTRRPLWASIMSELLLLVATRIQKETLDSQASTGSQVTQVYGGDNIVYVVQLAHFQLVLRVPTSGWSGRMAAIAARAMRPHITTLRVIRCRTKTPVP